MAWVFRMSSSSQYLWMVLRVSPPISPFPCDWWFPPIPLASLCPFVRGAIWAWQPELSETWSRDFQSAALAPTLDCHLCNLENGKINKFQDVFQVYFPTRDK